MSMLARRRALAHLLRIFCWFDAFDGSAQPYECGWCLSSASRLGYAHWPQWLLFCHMER